MKITAKPAEPLPHAIIERILVSESQPMFFGQLALYLWARDPDTGERFWVGAPITSELANDEEAYRAAAQAYADYELAEHKANKPIV